MKIFKSIAIGFFLLGTTIWGQDSKTTKVMDEMIQIHESLVKETAGKLETKKLVGLLNKGSDDKKDSAVYKAAVPFAEKLGKDRKSVV